jgi:hypothetical protein
MLLEGLGLVLTWWALVSIFDPFLAYIHLCSITMSVMSVNGWHGWDRCKMRVPLVRSAASLGLFVARLLCV